MYFILKINANKKIFYGLSKNYLDRRHNSREENIREKKLSVEDNFNKISAHKKQDIKLFDHLRMYFEVLRF